MSSYPRSPRRRLGAALLQACAALSLLACAHAVDNSATDSASDTTAGATGSGGSGAESGSANAGLGNASGSGDIAGQAQGGAASDDTGAGAPGSAGQVAIAGMGGAGMGGAGASGAGGASAGTAGSVAAAGSSGSHLCKVTTDLNVYTSSNTGCGGYAACKGQIHWRNDEAQTLTKLVLSFSEPAGTTCTDDNATSKWTITDNGATSHRCVFTASGTPLTVDSKSALSFGYDTNQTSSTAPTDISVADPNCN